MSVAFSALLASASARAGVLEAHISEDWMQGRSAFGGLQVALALKAMRSLVPDVPLRTLQTTFLAPVGLGPVHARAVVLRTGKNATHVEARIVDGESTLALIVGVFGLPRTSGVALTPRQLPVESRRPIELPFVPGMIPSFTQHFAVRWLQGMPPFSGDTAAEHVLEVALRDEGPASEAHVVAIADLVPPLGLSFLTALAPGSTITWMLEFLVDRFDHFPLQGWRVDARLLAARDGYTSQSVMLWSPGGEAVAVSQQHMLVFG